MEELLDFEKIYKDLNEVDSMQKLCELLVEFDSKWQENPIVYDFHYRNTRKMLFSDVVEKIIELKTYPLEIHSILLDCLSGEQMAKIVDNVEVSSDIIEDYEDKFCSLKQVNDCVEFAMAKGVNIEKLQANIIHSCDFEQYLVFVKKVESADISKFIHRLNNNIEMDYVFNEEKIKIEGSTRAKKMKRKQYVLKELKKIRNERNEKSLCV